MRKKLINCPTCGKTKEELEISNVKIWANHVKQCRIKANSTPKEKKFCLYCKGEIITRQLRKYCCKKCFDLAKIGVKRSKEHVEKARQGQLKIVNFGQWNRGRKYSPETIEKMRQGQKNRKRSEEEIKKLRLDFYSKIQYHCNNENIIFHPNFSIDGCSFFEKFDTENKTIGKYATNGGEYKIDKLGYWLDYINFDKKIIIEWDEPHHYYKNGELKPKDTKRQKEIMEIFPDFIFTRIKSWNRELEE